MAGIAAATGCFKDPPRYAATVCLDTRHHGVPAPEVDVYISSNSEDYIGFRQNMLSVYDSVENTGFGSTVCFYNLGVGKHYFAALGYDRLIRDSIRGTLTLDLTVRKRQIDTVLQVSETH